MKLFRTVAFIALCACFYAIAGSPVGADPPPATEPASTVTFRWPLTPTPEVVRPFQPPANPYGPGHRGVDLAAEPGAEVHAAAAGVVAFAGMVAGRGVVSVDHANGLRTTYEPVSALVSAGDTVAAGAVLGRLVAGHSGCTTTPCLHWGLRQGRTYLDPLSLLGRGKVRLLPIAAHVRAPLTPAGALAGTQLEGVPPTRGYRSGSWPAWRGRETLGPT